MYVSETNAPLSFNREQLRSPNARHSRSGLYLRGLLAGERGCHQEDPLLQTHPEAVPAAVDGEQAATAARATPTREHQRYFICSF